MTEESPLSYEDMQAWRFLDLATVHITDDVTKRSAWLLTAAGGAATLVISNATSVAALISSESMRASLALLVVSMLCGLAAQILGSNAKNALISGRAMLEIASSNHDPRLFFQAVLNGLSWSVCRRAERQARRPNPAGLLSLVYIPARLSQRQSLWSFWQLGFATAALLVVAIGVKA